MQIVGAVLCHNNLRSVYCCHGQDQQAKVVNIFFVVFRHPFSSLLHEEGLFHVKILCRLICFCAPRWNHETQNTRKNKTKKEKKRETMEGGKKKQQERERERERERDGRSCQITPEDAMEKAYEAVDYTKRPMPNKISDDLSLGKEESRMAMVTTTMSRLMILATMIAMRIFFWFFGPLCHRIWHLTRPSWLCRLCAILYSG